MIELENKQTLLDWLDEFKKPENQDKITLPNLIYSYPEIQRELTRRDNAQELRDAWLAAHKILPCPLCGMSWSKRGRGMTWRSAREHVLKCKGL